MSGKRRAGANGASDADKPGDEVKANADGAGTDESDDDTAAVTPRGKRGARRRRPGGTTATLEAEDRVDGEDKKPKRNRNPFTAIWVYLTQVVGELKKVIWPTRAELVKQTIIVLLFVIVMVAFVALLDVAFAKGVLAVFGGND